MSAPQAQPPIPHDHPLRAVYENERQSAMLHQQAWEMRLAELNRALGYDDGTARERRERARGYTIGVEERQAS